MIKNTVNKTSNLQIKHFYSAFNVSVPFPNRSLHFSDRFTTGPPIIPFSFANGYLIFYFKPRTVRERMGKRLEKYEERPGNVTGTLKALL